MARVGTLGLVSLLVACNDPAVERGTPQPIDLSVAQVTVSLYGTTAALVLRRAVTRLANGDRQAVRAVIDTADAPEAGVARARLIDDGIDPAAILTSSNPDDVIVLSRFTARPTSCREAIDPGWLGDSGNSVTSLGQCVQADNLAEMVVDPGDLVSPTPFMHADGAVAARAVLDWENGARVSPANASAPSGSSGGAGGIDAINGSAQTTSGAFDPHQGVGVPSANPLLAPEN